MVNNEGKWSQKLTEISYRTFAWIIYRLTATFGLGLPIVIITWASIKKEASIVRLLSIYWKVSSLILISILLLANKAVIGYITFYFAPILMVICLWFWVDLNEELADFPAWKALPLSVRIWRWSITFYGVISTTINSLNISCFTNQSGNYCTYLLEAPRIAHRTIFQVFGFLFGANWSEQLAAFCGFLGLIVYIIGLIQFILIKIPKQGRMAGGF
tara:strand:- start:303 stop:947 length:645 start_codon:yes stop_codon:yes gene_type:complete